MLNNTGKWREEKVSMTLMYYTKTLKVEYQKMFFKMFEVTFESVPQLYLQAYIICRHPPMTDFNGCK